MNRYEKKKTRQNSSVIKAVNCSDGTDHCSSRCGQLSGQDVGLFDLLLGGGGESDLRKQQRSSYLFRACGKNLLSSNISLSRATVALRHALHSTKPQLKRPNALQFKTGFPEGSKNASIYIYINIYKN